MPPGSRCCTPPGTPVWPGRWRRRSSAVDTALWDLKARLLGLPLAALFPGYRAGVPAYASGGFTSYPLPRLQAQLRGWSDRGFHAVKIKVGRDDAADDARVRAARAAVGPEVTLMVDANGAYTPRQAIERAHRFAEHGVGWLEEPVTSDDPDGLRFVRDHAPAGHVATGVGDLHSVEWFHDHVRVESLLFEGTVEPYAGMVTADPTGPGNGLVLRTPVVEGAA